ncbi:MAG: ATP-binding protein, partial [Longimicrobiales bacterium]
MLLHNTLEHLHALRLRGMAAALEEQLISSAVTDLSFEDRIGFLVEREVTWRDNHRLQRLLRDAKLREDASVEDINFRAARGLDRSVLMRLATCEWIRQHQVVLVVGPTGVGKTYLACALGQAACRRGFSTRYYRIGRLLAELALARADGSYAKLL